MRTPISPHRSGRSVRFPVGCSGTSAKLPSAGSGPKQTPERKNAWSRGILALLFFLAADAAALPASGGTGRDAPSVERIGLPGAEGGTGFDDISFAPGINRVLVAGGRTGILYLIDPSTREITEIKGFSSEESYKGGHGQGITSADEGHDLVFTTDRTAKTLNAVDPKAGKLAGSVPLEATPDYVRFIEAANEVWVTEPGAHKIEIFSLARPDKLIARIDSIEVDGGPESLLYDKARGRAYTNLWEGKTISIDVKTRRITDTWPNGCDSSRTLAMDDKAGFLFTGCGEGRASVLDLNHGGRLLGSLKAGAGVDVISYNPGLRRLYLPDGKSASLALLGVSENGSLSFVREIPTAKRAHCAASDSLGNVWVCDPENGGLILYKDQA